MVRWLLFVCLISGLTATASAEEYVLRVDTIRYSGQPKADQAPKETLLHRIEVLVEPAKPFHVKTQVGLETISVSGKFAPPEEDDATADFRIKVQYRYALYTGKMLIINRKEVKETVTSWSLMTQLDIDVGKTVDLGGVGDTWTRLVLIKSNPSAEK